MSCVPVLSLRVRIAPTPADNDDPWSFHAYEYNRGRFFYLAFSRGMETGGWVRKWEREGWTVIGWFKTREEARAAALKYAREEATRRRARAEADADNRTDIHEILCALAEHAKPYVANTETL